MLQWSAEPKTALFTTQLQKTIPNLNLQRVSGELNHRWFKSDSKAESRRGTRLLLQFPRTKNKSYSYLCPRGACRPVIQLVTVTCTITVAEDEIIVFLKGKFYLVNISHQNDYHCFKRLLFSLTTHWKEEHTRLTWAGLDSCAERIRKPKNNAKSSSHFMGAATGNEGTEQYKYKIPNVARGWDYIQCCTPWSKCR